MATTHTNLTVGKTYAVTSANGCTVTLANGVQLTLEAGQDYFTPNTPNVVISDDDATLTLLFNHAPGRRGSGGSVTIDPAPTQGSENAVSSGGVYTALRALPAPVPEPLGATTTLLHGHVYTLAVAADTDLSALTVKQYATCELWLDYTAGSVTWPALYWLDGTSSDAQHDHDVPPDMSVVGRYRVTLRNEGSGVTYANVAYSSAIPTTPAQS